MGLWSAVWEEVDWQPRSLEGLGTSQVLLGEGNLAGTWIPEIKQMETQTTMTWHLNEMCQENKF